MEIVTLNTAHLNLSGEMKQVTKATLAQSKEINAMKTEVGSIYSMLQNIHSHFMPNNRPLTPRPNCAELRANVGHISLESPSNNPLRRKQQKTTEEADIQLPHLAVPGLNEPSSKSGPRASANVATPEGPDQY
jgi:hypothetical protein